MASTSKNSTTAGRPKPGAARKKTGGTASGRLAIAILGGLAIGLVAMTIHGISESQSNWAFNRPEAQLPSLQSKHTLQ